jgi:hypothetical protein
MTEPTSGTEEPRAPRRSMGGVIVPLLLIGLGAAFLAGNLGYLPPISLRAVLGLWPLVLILVGLEVLFARRQPLLALALQLLVIALGVALVAGQPSGLFKPNTALTSSETVARDGATALTLGVSLGAGDLTVSGGSAALVDARVTGGEMRVRTERRDGRVEVDIDPEHEIDLFPSGVELDVAVASDVPVDLQVEAGAGDLRVDMRGLRVTRAQVEAGAGDITVVLPTPQGEVAVRVESGAAEITIEVPDGVEVRISVSGGAVSTDSDNARLRVDAGRAETSGYASASDRVTVTVEAGAASVHIR